MTKIKNIKTETYKINIPEEFYIDIIESDNIYEAWIYAPDISYKLYMFGSPKKQQSKSIFKKLVEKNIPEYAIQYVCEINEMEAEYAEEEKNNINQNGRDPVQ